MAVVAGAAITTAAITSEGITIDPIRVNPNMGAAFGVNRGRAIRA
jgi:hypothetical protein